MAEVLSTKDHFKLKDLYSGQETQERHQSLFAFVQPSYRVQIMLNVLNLAFLTYVYSFSQCHANHSERNCQGEQEIPQLSNASI